ncbi:hypothetical protein [Polaromonas naphthalenivorans]|uniref:Lipoprotein n=1 Tax=Polaromonas naphthalenivorans (strain CJ2) TaxID=365044 RepID=A1VIA2_POLNA|nr:hypothetical protein [Polaromonas naphthalenivorans]ABM35380.1 hypothetical protein Pnap_0054 [Polaromonas naphthalenivorans CJ2]
MRHVLTLAAASAMLVACGGGSDSAPAATPTPAATQATLTSANYVAVAQESLSSSAYLANTTGLVTGAQVSDSEALIRFGQDQLPKLPRWLADAPVQAVGAVQSQTENCAGGGTLTISANDANGNRLVDAGDSVSLTANNCSFEGQLLNGQLTLTINSLTGNPDHYPYSLSVTLGFNNLATQSASLRTVGNGSLALSIDARAANDQSLVLRTSSLNLSSTYGTTTYSKTLTGYATSVELRPAGTGFTSTTSVDGTLSSSAFESRSISIATPVSFVRTSGQTYPSSGQLVITGAAGGKIRVTVTSATTVLIELDADANGSYEASTSKLWSDML